MSSNMYVLDDAKVAKELYVEAYESEANLQEIIKANPNLLLRPSEQENTTLMLIKEEEPVKISGDTGGSYWLDLLMVDRDSTPVLVEIKLSKNPQIHRMVIGQMFDYASRARTWDIDVLKNQFRASNAEKEELLPLCNDSDFWSKLETNLRAENLRLVFVADSIPDTLRVLIEFIDRNMPNIDIYGVEVPQFKTENSTMLTTSYIESAVKESIRAQREGCQWDINSFKNRMKEHGYGREIPILDELLNTIKGSGLDYYFGQGPKNSNIIVTLGKMHPFQIGAYEYAVGVRCPIELGIKRLLQLLPDGWTDQQLRKHLTPFEFPENPTKKTPYWFTPDYLYIDIKALSQPIDRKRFLDALTEIMSLIRVDLA